MPLPGILVSYYSWTGNTEKVARRIAETLSADIEQIHDVNPRKGSLAFPAAVLASLIKTSPPIEQGTRPLADYDIVILGCPVWASNMATPMRTYIMREQARLKRIALFCTFGGSGGKAALAQMATLCGRSSLADLILDRAALASGAWRGLTETFERQIQSQQSQEAGAAVPGLAAA